jgi:ribonuclease G
MLAYQPCPYCRGRAKVKSAVTMAVYALKELRRFLKGKSLKQASISLNPAVIDEILKNKSDLKSLEQRFRTEINLISSPALHIEDIKIS